MRKPGLLPNHVAKKIQEINKRYPNINYGGCGAFSYYLHQTLKKKYGQEVSIVYIPCEKTPENAFGVKFRHMMVSWKNWYIDNNGFYSNHSKGIEISPRTLKAMIDVPHLWNSQFEKSNTESMIEDLKRI